METAMKTTPLHAWHVGQSANMAAFGGYEMPLWYPAGAKAEHLAVITAAGLFDTSHMAVLTLSGPRLDYMIVVNASMGGPIASHLREQNRFGGEAAIVDRTDRVGKMDIQGPRATAILSRVLKEPLEVFDKMVYFSF